MANRILFKRGNRSTLPTLNYGEPAFVADEKELYIGTSSGNIKLTRNSEVSALTSNLNKVMVTAKNFGALGNGSTNDGKAIQNFLDFCSQYNVIGRVESGVYILEKQLNIKSNTTLIFDTGAEFKQTHGNTMINIQNNTHTGYNGYRNISIYGATFNCNGAVIRDPMDCFFIQHAQNVEFNSCTFKNVHSYHALDINGCKNIRILNCKFIDSYDSISKDDREAIQIDICAPDASQTDPCWDYTPSIDILVENCYFGTETSGALPYTAAVGSHNVRYDKFYENIVIRNNYIEGCSKYGISGWKWNNCLIENNTIKNCAGGIKLDTPHRNAASGQNTSGVYKGLQATYGNKIINNNITDVTSTEGIFIRGKYITSPSSGEAFDGTMYDILISGNIISQTSAATYPSLVLLNTYRSTVESNIIKNSYSDGIRVYSSYENIIKGNKIYEAGNYGISISNAALTGTDGTSICTGNVVDSNIIKNAIKCGIFLTNGASYTGVNNNTILNANKSADSTGTVINISASSNYVTVSNNKIIDTTTFKNLIFITNTCSYVAVTNNVTNTGTSSNKIYNASTGGITVDNI